MVVHVGMCAHRISRDLWLKDHHGMGREVVLRKSTYRGEDAAGGWRGAREEEFSPDRRELSPNRPFLAPVFLAWNGKLFNLEIEPSCRSCVQRYPSFGPRSDWGLLVLDCSVECCWREEANRPRRLLWLKIWAAEKLLRCGVGTAKWGSEASFRAPVAWDCVWGLCKPLKNAACPSTSTTTKTPNKPAQPWTNELLPLPFHTAPSQVKVCPLRIIQHFHQFLQARNFDLKSQSPRLSI